MLTIHESSQGVAFWIHVTPRSRQERVGGSHGDALRVGVGAPPVAGAANDACVEALARALAVRTSAVSLESHSRGRRKRVQVAGDAAALAARLRQLAGEETSG